MTKKTKATAKAAPRYLSADEILGLDDRRQESVHVPEWGCDVIVKTMSGCQRDALELSLVEAKDVKDRMANYRARIVVATAIKEDGSPLFTFEQVEKLGEKAAAALDRIVNVAKRLNGISEEDEKELVKN